MLRHERRLLVDCLGIGVALTLMVVAADAYGLLHRLEDFLYDLRARHCQQFTPKPTDTLVHLDIDDPALEAIGWPLPRAEVARILDEVRLAGPKAVEMDILFTEPQAVQYIPKPAHASTQPAGTQPATKQAATAPPAALEFTSIDHDAELAQAMRQLGNVIVPATFQTVPKYSPLVAAMVEELRKDPELDPEPLADIIRSRKTVEVKPEGLGEQFFVARREAFDIRLRELNLFSDTPFDVVRAKLLPKTAIEVRTGAVNVLGEQWNKYVAEREFRRFGWRKPPGMATYGTTRVTLAPIRAFSAGSAGGAFVDYTQFGSPVIRALPLLLECDGRIYPQMGLALACRMLDADVTQIRDAGGSLIVPRDAAKGGDIVIPLSPPRAATSGNVYGHLMDIPWFGPRQWETMYDWPAHKTSSQHIPMNQVWQAVVARQKIERNNQTIDDATSGLFDSMGDTARLAKFRAAPLPLDDFPTRQKLVRALLEEFAPYVEQYATMKPTELTGQDHAFLAAVKALRQAMELTPALLVELDGYRANLKQRLAGKAVLVGWTATAAIADFVPTSLHEKCPGPVVHGVVFNGIMTGEMWRRAPAWVAALTTFFLGSLISLTTARVPPLKAMLVAVAVAAAFAFVNGTVLFDYGNIILPAAAPLVAIALAWCACTLTRVMIESAERNRITKRFSNYVDPKIVSYVMENPNVTFDGETREMTVVFTDLAGFTAISERLGEKVVPMLNELFGELVPVIRANEGTLNKFLGDGIMFFFNAPRNMPSHAAVAVKAVLEMQQKVGEFNVRLKAQGLPQLAMRAGIMTANMIVGDAGGAGAADYTVLGDAVNTGARLEPANKFVGTETLISARTASLLDGNFLIRPIGRLKVVGKDEAVMVYEPMEFSDRATDEQRELAKCTAEMVDAFVQGRFGDSLALAGAHENRFGKSKLADIYQRLAQQNLDNPPGDDFDGRIVLTEK